jgi:hypothetical protein
MRSQYYDKNKHNTADYRAFAKFKQQTKDCIEADAGPGKKSLDFPFKGINKINSQLKYEKTESSKKRKAEPLLSNDINAITSIDEDE